MRLGTGFASFRGEEMDIVVKQRTYIAAVIILGKQCNLEVETVIPRDMFESKAVQERAMD